MALPHRHAARAARAAALLAASAAAGETTAPLVSMLEAQRKFADALTAELHKNDNDCTSSWGVSMMFSLVFPGADEAMAGDMCTHLGFCFNTTRLAWNETAGRLAGAYDGVCIMGGEDDGECLRKAPTLEVANSVWADTGTDDLRTEYQDVVGSYLRRTNFTDDGAGGVVNDWVENATHSLIDSILEPGPIDYDLLAVNSIYLNATWEDPFKEEFTNEDLFYADVNQAAETATIAQFMHIVDSFPYSDDALPDYQIIQLPFTASSLSMLITLPTSAQSDRVSSSELLKVLPKLDRTRVALALPKFKFDSEYEEDLKLALKSIGLTAPFDLGFCRIFEKDCALLDLIKQKTFINVHETGTEAAAVTVGGFERSSGSRDEPVLFMGDHPFQFFIYDEEEDLVLFEGRVGDPKISEDSSQAQLKSKHSDSDFWSKNFNVEPGKPSVSSAKTDPPQPTESTMSPSGAPTETPMSTMPPSPSETSGPTMAPSSLESSSGHFQTSESWPLLWAFACVLVFLVEPWR